MIRKEAVKLASQIIGNAHIISANGYISRDLYEADDKETNFYMLGSMGLASSIGLGIALSNPKFRVFVFDGDGNILMNLGSLTTIGILSPKNLIHIIFDNNSHESTGGQPTHTKKVNIGRIAQTNNYRVFQTSTKSGLAKILTKTKTLSGPIMIVIKIKKSKYISKRVEIEPKLIRKRFCGTLEKKARY